MSSPDQFLGIQNDQACDEVKISTSQLAELQNRNQNENEIEVKVKKNSIDSNKQKIQVNNIEIDELIPQQMENSELQGINKNNKNTLNQLINQIIPAPFLSCSSSSEQSICSHQKPTDLRDQGEEYQDEEQQLGESSLSQQIHRSHPSNRSHRSQASHDSLRNQIDLYCPAPRKVRKIEKNENDDDLPEQSYSQILGQIKSQRSILNNLNEQEEEFLQSPIFQDSSQIINEDQEFDHPK